LPATSPWTFHVTVVQGVTHLEARTGDDVHFTISCLNLNMQTPNGNLQASGSVQFTGPNVEGACDKLVLAWADEHVSLEGNVSLRCLQNGQDVDLRGEKLSIKLAAIETLPPPAKASKREMPSATAEAW
jgi:hypothetical protein